MPLLCTGDMMSVTVFGQTYVILNSSKRAVELLDDKGAIYSCRPVIPVGGELVGWNRALVALPYHDGSKFRHVLPYVPVSTGS